MGVWRWESNSDGNKEEEVDVPWWGLNSGRWESKSDREKEEEVDVRWWGLNSGWEKEDEAHVQWLESMPERYPIWP